MDDLVSFVARDDVDPITQAAVAHAQFETIHPFADGNGRIGRVLIGWMLATRLGVNVPPPVSLQMARDVGGYQAGLTLYRQGMHDTWVSWFADAISHASEESIDVLASVAELQNQWQDAIGDLRADSAARRVCAVLPEHPVVSTATVAGFLDISREAARVALVALAERGVLEEIDGPVTRGRPQRWWEARALLGLLGRGGR